ncbi:hypothetical protein OH460_08125 [Vibrio sp. Makdt]|uniref:hypothetical protein n=1 Tax=Vibrio sp. Makdt TaxID=2998828 RepID=UPI0022CD50DE|nr:hypothetical protein [Vibrio sp. Makdt]MDA0152265.1 hypothetical protein [Vibrio sp. Makdt]
MSVLIDCKTRMKPNIERMLATLSIVSMVMVYLASHYEWSESIRFVLGLPALFYIVILAGTKAAIWEKVEYEHGRSASKNDHHNE